MRPAVVLLAVLAGLSTRDASGNQREFSDASGQFRVHAELLEFRDGEVRLRRADGAVVTVPIETLSPDCQEFVRSQDSSHGKGLEATLAELIAELQLVDARAGIIAQVSGKRVYVSLGEADGIEVGTELAIVGPSDATQSRGAIRESEPSQPVGTLRVVSVQERLSVCRLIDGRAEQRDAAGKFQRVLRADELMGIPIALGQVVPANEGGVTSEMLAETLRDVFRQQELLQPVSTRTAAVYELQVAARAAPGGAEITITATDRPAGRPVAEASGVFQSGPPLAALGYRAAVVGELGVELTMPPVRRAFENRNIPPQDAGQTLFLKNAGPRGEDAWVFPSGRIVIATSRSVADTRIFGQLLQTWNDVAQTIAGVTAQIEASHVSSLLQRSSEIYTQEANQLQSLFFRNQRTTTGWRLSWPEAKPSWATLMATGSGNSYWPSKIAIGEKVRISNGTRIVQEAPIHDLQFGEHSVSYNQFGNQAIDIQIVAFFREPRGRIGMFDSQNAPAATREVLSKPLDSLYLPLPPES